MGRSSRNNREIVPSRQVYTSSDEEYTTDFYSSDNVASATSSPTIPCPHPPREIRSSSLRKVSSSASTNRKSGSGGGKFDDEDDVEMAEGGGPRHQNSKALFEPSDTEGESSIMRNKNTPPLATKSKNWPKPNGGANGRELTRERSAFVYEENDDGSIEARDVSKWPDYWHGDEHSKKKRVCTRRRFCALFCCLLIVGLIIVLVFAVRNQAEDDVVQEEQQQIVAATSEGGDTEPAQTPNPTPAPTLKPEVPASSTSQTPAPTPNPTPAPVPVPDTTPNNGCVDEIGTSTDTYCIAPDDPVLVGFTSCNTKQNEWIGLYAVDNIIDVTRDLGPLHTDWLWTCYIVGDVVDECRSQAFLKGIVPFASNLLEPGTYQAFLAHTNEQMEYVPMKASAPFTVAYC